MRERERRKENIVERDQNQDHIFTWIHPGAHDLPAFIFISIIFILELELCTWTTAIHTYVQLVQVLNVSQERGRERVTHKKYRKERERKKESFDSRLKSSWMS